MLGPKMLGFTSAGIWEMTLLDSAICKQDDRLVLGWLRNPMDSVYLLVHVHAQRMFSCEFTMGDRGSGFNPVSQMSVLKRQPLFPWDGSHWLPGPGSGLSAHWKLAL